MTTPFSQDLRGRIVRCVAAGTSARSAAQRFDVTRRPRSSFCSVFARREAQLRRRLAAIVGRSSEPHADALRKIAKSKRGITLRECATRSMSAGSA